MIWVWHWLAFTIGVVVGIAATFLVCAWLTRSWFKISKNPMAVYRGRFDAPCEPEECDGHDLTDIEPGEMMTPYHWFAERHTKIFAMFQSVEMSLVSNKALDHASDIILGKYNVIEHCSVAKFFLIVSAITEGHQLPVSGILHRNKTAVFWLSEFTNTQPIEV